MEKQEFNVYCHACGNPLHRSNPDIVAFCNEKENKEDSCKGAWEEYYETVHYELEEFVF